MKSTQTLILIPTLLGLAFLPGCFPPPPAGPPLEDFKTADAFLDVTESAFNPAPFASGWPGLAVFDYDNDGDLDVLVTAPHGRPNLLYQNDGLGHFVDVAAAAGCARIEDMIVCTGVGDFDNDGWLDLLLGRQALGSPLSDRNSVVYLKNMGSNADGVVHFEDRTVEAGLTTTLFASGIGVGDVDNDGLLDLYIGRYNYLDLTFDFGTYLPDHPNALLRSTGIVNGVPVFADVTIAAGVAGTAVPGLAPDSADIINRVPTWSVYMTDVNADGWVDIFATQEVPGGVDLFINNGNLTFSPSHTDLLNKHGGWMGIAGADYDRDGDIDYFLTNVGADAAGQPVESNHLTSSFFRPEGSPFHRLLRNDGAGNLVDAINEHPVLEGPLPPVNALGGTGLGAYEFGFGCAWFDVQNDGWPDLHWIGDLIQFDQLGDGQLRADFNGVGRFFRNRGDGSFADRTAERGLFNWASDKPLAFGFSEEGRALAAADFNGDSAVDLCRTNLITGDPDAQVFRCLMNPATGLGHWIIIRLRGTTGNRFGIGARVVARAGADVYAAEVVTTTGAFTAVHPQARFGLGDTTGLDSVDVHWPAGGTTQLTNVTVDRVLTITE